MVPKFQSLFPIIKERLEGELVREVSDETDELVGVPYPYVTPAATAKNALYYWDSYFLNLGLIRLKLVDLARHHVENLTFLSRRRGYVPVSNLRAAVQTAELPLLPWMVRDVYRATGDKDWLSRMLPDVLAEFRFWTNETHTAPIGLYRFGDQQAQVSYEAATCLPSRLYTSSLSQYAPVDLNALLCRNAKMIYDLQVEADGQGDPQLLQLSQEIKNAYELLWDEKRQFYFDRHLVDNRFVDFQTLAGFIPLFVEMADAGRAELLQRKLEQFVAPGGVNLLDRDYGTPAGVVSRSLLCAPYLYFLVKGLIDYEFMEDAADIGVNWLTMVHNVYKRTGEMWQWYNVAAKNALSPERLNTPNMGATAGAFITLVDELGLD